MLEYNSEYKVLICRIHKYAVHDAEKHLCYDHCITGQEKGALLDQWKGLDLVNPKHCHRPRGGREPKDFLDHPVLGYSCSSCFFLNPKWESIQSHHMTFHGREIAATRPRKNKPNPDVKLVYLQTIFPPPHIKWFTVSEENAGESHDDKESCVVTNPPEDATARDSADKRPDEFLPAQRKAIKDQHRDGLKLRKQQRLQAPKLREANAASLYLARLPLEIRREIYKLVLGAGTVFHIVDESAVVKPSKSSYGTGTGGHGAGANGSVRVCEDRKLRKSWEDALEDTVDAQYEAGEKTRLRAVSIPRSNPHSLAILKVCSQFNEEATSIFYSSNQLRLHSGTADFSTALQFLSLLSPATRKCITSFGVAGLQPCLKVGPGRYGFKWRTSEFSRKCRLYYQSERKFVVDALPQMALKEIDLGFDLSHLGDDYVEKNGIFQMIEYSPNASWLSKFLKLPLQRINLNFGSAVMGHRVKDDCPVNVLIDALNLIDSQTRVRAKNEWDDNF